MKCEGCDHELRPDQVRAGVRFHSPQCALTSRRGKKIIPITAYRMKCHQCGGWYDGREGPWVGLCSAGCVEAWLPKLERWQHEEAELWRRHGRRLAIVA
jgi:hypothetical protein